MEAPFCRGDTSGDEIHRCLGWPSLAGSLVVSVERILLPGPRTPGNMRGRRRCRASNDGCMCLGVCWYPIRGQPTFKTGWWKGGGHRPEVDHDVVGPGGLSTTFPLPPVRSLGLRLSSSKFGPPALRTPLPVSYLEEGALERVVLWGGVSRRHCLFRRGLPAAPATGLIRTKGNIWSCSGSFSGAPPISATMQPYAARCDCRNTARPTLWSPSSKCQGSPNFPLQCSGSKYCCNPNYSPEHSIGTA